MSITGELRQWHKVTVDFEGPFREENAETFRDYRLNVTFTNEETGTVIDVPGFFAADGAAADSSATSGDVWRVHFNPPEQGNWTYEASFVTGEDVAVLTSTQLAERMASDPGSVTGVAGVDGQTGTLAIAESDKAGDDLRAKGLLQYDGDQYLSFAGDGSIFLKSGVGSPENFLAYEEFDNTISDNQTHLFEPHVADFNPGDPTWGDGKGEGIIGAVNYLAEQDVNSLYFMLNNVGGDGRDVWPWAADDLNKIAKNAGNSAGSFNLTDDAQIFDVSKLAQWDIVFQHMQEEGITLHAFFQETENDFILNDGEIGLERMLLVREMVARFGYHNGIIYNLGEENTNTTGQIADFSAYLKEVDPYDHPVAMHTYPYQYGRYENHYGTETLDVYSIQTGNDTHDFNTQKYLGGAEEAGRPAVAFLDEPGNASIGVAAEGDPGYLQNWDNLREVLWDFYTEGGSGAEWYFGYQTGNGQAGDLRAEDFATREPVFEWAAAARTFFEQLPLDEMQAMDNLVNAAGAQSVIAKEGELYGIFLPEGGSATLDLSGVQGTFSVGWYDPLTGGVLQESAITEVTGGGTVDLGSAPLEAGRDWAILVQRTGDGPPIDTPPVDDPPADDPPVDDPPVDDLPGDTQPLTDEAAIYRLFDADTGEFLTTVADGDLIDEALIEGRTITLTADPVSEIAGAVDSVRLTLGNQTQTENVAPYALFGDRNGSFQGQGTTFEPGDVVVETAYFAGANGGGQLLATDTLSFSIISTPQPDPEPVNALPELTNLTFTVEEDAEGFVISANDLGTDPEGEDLFFDFIGDAANGTANGAGEGSLLFYTPQADFNGTDSFDVIVSDRTGQGTEQVAGTVTITVTPVNDAPVALDDGPFEVPAGPSVAFSDQLLANDSDLEGDALSIVSATPNDPEAFFSLLVFPGSGEGVVSVNLDPAFTGTTSFDYVIEDENGAQATATATLFVPEPPPEPEPDPVMPGEVVFALNAGGAATTEDGISYEAGRDGTYVTTGFRNYGNQNGEVIQSENWARNLDYDVALDNGTYQVTLQFAEIYFNAEDRRIFDVELEGELVLDDLDIFAEVGADTLLEKTFEVTVEDGVLDLDMSASVNNAKLAGIVIRTAGMEEPPAEDLPADEPAAETPVLEPALAEYFLFDASTGEALGSVGDGDILDAFDFRGRKVALTADPDASIAGHVESARLTYDGNTQTESFVPYALFGDIDGDFRGKGLTLSDGIYEINVAFFDDIDGTGNLLGADTVTFEVANDFIMAA